MKEYNWEERNIIRMPGEIALHTEDLHVYYGDNEACLLYTSDAADE